MVATILHCFCPPKGQNSQKSPKKRKKSKTHVFYLVRVQFFSWCRSEPQNGVFLTPIWERDLKTPTFGGPTRAPKKLYAHKMGGGTTRGGGVPFSLLACILWETSLAHRFHRKSPKIAKSGHLTPSGRAWETWVTLREHGEPERV